MDSSSIFATLQGGTRFDKKKFHKDIDFFERAEYKTLSAKTPSGTSPAKSLDFFRSKKRKRSDTNVVKNPKKRKSVAEPEEREDASSSDDVSTDSESSEAETEVAEVAMFKTSSKIKKKEKQRSGVPHEEKINVMRKQNKIRLRGEKVDPVENFSDLNTGESSLLPAYILRNLEELDYDQPTPVQMQALPLLLRKKNLLTVAPTGSGKTAAFLLPLLANLKKPAKSGIRALIVTPTRELAHQINTELLQLSKGRYFKSLVLSKGNVGNLHPTSPQSRVFDIIVSAPMRLVYLIQSNSIDLSTVQYLVLDEADRLLSMGFKEQVTTIMDACNNDNTQKSLWSATMDSEIEKLAKSALGTHSQLVVGRRLAGASGIKQRLVFVGREEGKLFAMRQVVREGIKPPVLVFVQSKERAKQLFQELIYDGLNCDLITSNRSKAQREEIIRKFRTGKIWILIATDLMARGMDFPAVHTVINYDLPQTTREYIHRIGRTGRAGREGEAITLYTEVDMDMLRSIGNIMKNSGCEVPDWVLKLSKISKNKRRDIAKKPVERHHISTASTFDRKQGFHLKREKKQQQVARINRKKQRFNTNNENKGTNQPQKPNKENKSAYHKTQNNKNKTKKTNNGNKRGAKRTAQNNKRNNNK